MEVNEFTLIITLDIGEKLILLMVSACRSRYSIKPEWASSCQIL